MLCHPPRRLADGPFLPGAKILPETKIKETSGQARGDGLATSHQTQPNPMLTLLFVPIVAAAGYSLIYLLFGGGLFGAIFIFIIAKMLGK